MAAPLSWFAASILPTTSTIPPRGGGGKIPLLPEYVVRLSDDEIVLRNFRGRQYVWKQPREDEALVAAATGTDGASVVPIRRKSKKKRTVRKSR